MRKSITTFAREYDISRGTVHNRIKDGTLTAERIDNRIFVIQKREYQQSELKKKAGRPKKERV